MAKHITRWNSRPATHDFKAAFDYLTMQFTTSSARKLVRSARTAPRIERIAKDILRASNLPLLPIEERHVAENLKRIRKSKPLSPIILIQGDLTVTRPFIIADGYHRICASCHADEDAPVAAVMVSP
jgi:plasmid stabilization system protein ParE